LIGQWLANENPNKKKYEDTEPNQNSSRIAISEV
jgi:hypothetical protein